jgi:hypothetical protein
MGVICLRCDGVTIEPLESPDGIEFFRCPSCLRNYARRAGMGLTDRWMSPISLVLYAVIFETDPCSSADRVARAFLAKKTPEHLRRIVDDIRDELARPKQRVRDILKLRANEVELREYLRCVADLVEAAICDDVPG